MPRENDFAVCPLKIISSFPIVKASFPSDEKETSPAANTGL
ncbi:MAG: hypothetical protein ABIL04_02250 [candidate division WOR-3 bacterium]